MATAARAIAEAEMSAKENAFKAQHEHRFVESTNGGQVFVVFKGSE